MHMRDAIDAYKRNSDYDTVAYDEYVEDPFWGVLIFVQILISGACLTGYLIYALLCVPVPGHHSPLWVPSTLWVPFFALISLFNLLLVHFVAMKIRAANAKTRKRIVDLTFVLAFLSVVWLMIQFFVGSVTSQLNTPALIVVRTLSVSACFMSLSNVLCVSYWISVFPTPEVAVMQDTKRKLQRAVLRVKDQGSISLAPSYQTNFLSCLSTLCQEVFLSMGIPKSTVNSFINTFPSKLHRAALTAYLGSVYWSDCSEAENDSMDRGIALFNRIDKLCEPPIKITQQDFVDIYNLLSATEQESMINIAFFFVTNFENSKVWLPDNANNKNALQLGNDQDKNDETIMCLVSPQGNNDVSFSNNFKHDQYQPVNNNNNLEMKCGTTI